MNSFGCWPSKGATGQSNENHLNDFIQRRVRSQRKIGSGYVVAVRHGHHDDRYAKLFVPRPGLAHRNARLQCLWTGKG